MGFCFSGYLKDKGRRGGETFRLVINPGKDARKRRKYIKKKRTLQKLNENIERQKHTVLLHDAQKLDNDLGRRPDQDLPLARLLGVVDGIQGVVENGSLDHFDRGCGLLQLSKIREHGSVIRSSHFECPPFFSQADRREKVRGIQKAVFCDLPGGSWWAMGDCVVWIGLD